MNAKRKFETQKKIISRQSKQIEFLKQQNEELKEQIEEKNNIINSVDSLRNELTNDIAEIKKYKKQYKILIEELRKMKAILNQEVYKGRWSLIKFLIK